MNKIEMEFMELCEQCKNNNDVEYIVLDSLDELMEDLLMEQREQM